MISDFQPPQFDRPAGRQTPASQPAAPQPPTTPPAAPPPAIQPTAPPAATAPPVVNVDPEYLKWLQQKSAEVHSEIQTGPLQTNPVPIVTPPAKPNWLAQNWMRLIILLLLVAVLVYAVARFEFGIDGKTDRPTDNDTPQVIDDDKDTGDDSDADDQSDTGPVSDNALLAEETLLRYRTGLAMLYVEAQRRVLADEIRDMEDLRKFLSENTGQVRDVAFKPLVPVFESLNGDGWSKEKAARILGEAAEGYKP